MYEDQDAATTTAAEAMERRQKLYKTQMCRHIWATGTCAHGAYCHFAHSESELRPLGGGGGPPLLRQDSTATNLTSSSPTVTMTRSSAWDEYGVPPEDVLPTLSSPSAAEQQHSALQAHYASLRYKTRMCRHVARGGRCPRGSTCGFAHSESELRRAPTLETTVAAMHTASLQAAWNTANQQNLQHQSAGVVVTAQQQQPPPPLPPWHQPQQMITAATGATKSGGRRGPRQSMFKTRICRYAEVGAAGKCPRGDTCTFAHSEAELRAVPRRHQPRPLTDCTARWKGAIFAARKNRAVLEALRDALIRQYRGRRLRAPPTSPPPVLSTFVTDQHSDSEDPSNSMQSAFSTGILVDPMIGAEDERLPFPPGAEARESSQVRYLCLEIECCYSEELRRRSDAQTQFRNWLLMARYLALAVELVQAAIQGVSSWHSILVGTPEAEDLSDLHDRDQLEAVLTVLTIVRNHTRHALDEAIKRCETVVRDNSDDDQSRREAAEGLDMLRRLRLD